jgi:hypothetical protein
VGRSKAAWAGTDLGEDNIFTNTRKNMATSSAITQPFKGAKINKSLAITQPLKGLKNKRYTD